MFKTMVGVSRVLPVYFTKEIETTDIPAHINIGRLYVKRLLKWIMFSNAVPAKKIANMISAMASAHLKPLK